MGYKFIYDFFVINEYGQIIFIECVHFFQTSICYYNVGSLIGWGPEWPHRQCVGLAFWSRTFVANPVQQVLRFAARIAVCNTWSSGGTALRRVGGATSQLDLPSLTPLSVAGCGWLQLGALHWATSVITASSW